MTFSSPLATTARRRSLVVWQRWLQPLLGITLLVAVWQVWSLSRGSEHILAAFSPVQTVYSLWNLLSTGALLPHIWVSLKRVVIGIGLGVLIGLPLGILLGTQVWLERTTAPVVHLLRMISPLSWMPIAIMLLGIGDAPVYFLLGIATLFPIMLNTRSGIGHVDRRWLLAVRSLGANRWQLVRFVYLPAVLTHTLTGLRLAVGLAWIVLVPAEMLGVSAGLGYYILDTRDRLAYGEMMAVILVIGVLGCLFDSIARWTVARLTPYLQQQAG